MGQAIQKLLALQDVDLEVISLSEEKAKRLDSINRKRSELEAERGEFQKREGQLKELKVGMKNMEVELADTTERIRKLESQQINVKTNQEYKALDKEIYEAKANKIEVEDKLLQKMELLEEGKAEVQKAGEQLAARSTELEGETAGIQEEVEKIDRHIADLTAKRSEVAANIEDNLLRQYERIFNTKKGAVLVPLLNRACQGCHLSVPAGIESILRRYEADIITCENCSRILYIPEQAR
jgi:predicted  nucleic acid-binding Zn-ribbon protein